MQWPWSPAQWTWLRRKLSEDEAVDEGSEVAQNSSDLAEDATIEGQQTGPDLVEPVEEDLEED